MRSPEEALRFLNPSFDDLPDPFLLPDAGQAAERIKHAIAGREKIIVHGDYDGDGVTSAALWTRLLRSLDAQVEVHVPHRQKDGYDMRSKFVAEAKERGIDLIITTDCGIQRVDEVEEARQVGIDVIVTDHHTPKEAIPNAVAVVNPHRLDSVYPFSDLAGVGVAFRMGEALVRHLGENVDSYRKAFVDLAAIGTVTDMMPLLGDNRVIVKHGLERLKSTKKVGIQALIRSAGIRAHAITARDLGYAIGPRLNAAGRVDDSALSLNLLLTKDEAQATTLASTLEKANNERRQEQDRVFMEALNLLSEQDLSGTGCLVVAGENWNSGVVGLVANKLVDRFSRPVIVIAADGESGVGKGSARSIPAFHMLNAMTSCADHLDGFGGHSHAAGLSLDLNNLDEFREAMNRQALETLTEEDFIPCLEADMEIDPAQVTLRFMQELQRFEPWGCCNEEPLFISRGLNILDVRRIGKEANHLKLVVRAEAMQPTDICWWGCGDLADHLHPGDSITACYRPQINHYNGRSSVQFILADLRPSDFEGDF
jgi:single-stranded-DNA-specific exonuclease